MTKRSHILFALPLLLLAVGGCEDIIRGMVPIEEADLMADPPDGGPGMDADGLIPDFLTLTSVKPNHGPFVGGNRVVISGSGFDKEIEILIGGKAIQVGETVLLSPVAVEVVVPPGEAGSADIEVKKSGSDEQVKLPGAYTYDPVFVDPPTGPSAGGTLVTITGAGTDFEAGMKLELGGEPMTDVEVVSATTLRAKTPPHADGPASLLFDAPSGEVEIEEAFTYYSSTNPLSGGMGGGPITGTVTVSVLNWLTRAPIDDAVVVLQKGRDLTLTGKTDSKGVFVFSHADLLGPITVTAAKQEHEAATVVSFDARDLTIFLTPIIQPQPGPLPPGQRMGLVEGHVLFGGATGAGSTNWNLVPEPKTGQKKRVYVYATNSEIRFGPPFPTDGTTIDFEPSQATAWPFTLNTRVGTMAIYAVAGLYAESTDTFKPYAIGITRGVVMGPGERRVVNVMINTPLTEKVTVVINNPPPHVNRYRLRLSLALGAEGFLLRDDTELEGDGIPATLAIGRLPSFTKQGFTDASFAVDLLLDDGSNPDGLPVVRATERSIQPNVDGQIILDNFVGAPLQVKPTAGGPLQGNTLRWSYTGEASLAVTTLQLQDETPVWRVISAGQVTEVKLPDPATFGLPPWPQLPISWLQHLAHLPDFDYNTFNYTHLRTAYWDRWSFDQFFFNASQQP